MLIDTCSMLTKGLESSAYFAANDVFFYVMLSHFHSFCVICVERRL